MSLQATVVHLIEANLPAASLEAPRVTHSAENHSVSLAVDNWFLAPELPTIYSPSLFK